MTSRKKAGVEARAAPQWLLLIHQLPQKPAYLRVKVWRRLQGLGAVAVKSSVYALPAGEETLEDFQWLLREIEQGGGEGAICEASLVDGLSDPEMRALFEAARDADYAEVAKELRKLAASARGAGERGGEAGAQLTRLRRRFAEVAAIDFFGASGRLVVDGLLTELETSLGAQDGTDEEEASMSAIPDDLLGKNLIGKTWVTRQGVYIDRIACAWLIRRFIDPKARFKFVAAKDYRARAGELRFDMFQGEFTHEGDKCSFEVLLERLRLADKALIAIAEIVHDIDLKDGKFGRAETEGIAHVISGICASQKEDLMRIERGSQILDDSYESFRKRRGR
jgi:hypothetical protein